MVAVGGVERVGRRGERDGDAICLMGRRRRRRGTGLDVILQVVHCVEARMMAFGCREQALRIDGGGFGCGWEP